MATAESTGNQAFIDASKEALSLPSGTTNESKLKLYAYYKQGIIGDNETPKPGLMDFTGKAKWEAWNEVTGMSKEDAQQKYIDLVNELKGSS